MKLFRVLVVLVALAVAGVSPAGAVRAADGPYRRGPDPTTAGLQAEKGPFAIAQVTVGAGSGAGFNKGTVYYPVSTSEGRFGAVVVMPGFLGPEFSVGWYGPRLASQGFVVFTLEPVSVLDRPDSRADQMLAALDYLTGRSEVRDRVDADRLAVMGHSMGGGGALSAAQKRPALRAAVPLAPWHQTQGWPGVKVPTMIFGSDNDFIAPAATYAGAFYASLTSAPEKAYVLLKNAGHAQYILPNTAVAQYGIAWLKRFVDDDTRYTPFLCPAPAPSSTIAKFEETCPL
ncbi:dienelactone hydrolase family protein [Actinocorallia longicatena]|uniref:Poly(ethylene terephthalate) hydrolase n=1 Tax=Actinocorallia longicatena TaxID=111803 RepID=A0ABP6PWL3_9ACTN